MAWRAITVADLTTRLSGSELEGFRAAALASGQSDPVQPVIDQITDLVRGYIAGCEDNTLGLEGTIPTKLLGPALDLIVPEISKRAAGMILDSKGLRADAAERAMSILRDVSRCDLRIEAPEEETEEEIGALLPNIVGRTPIFGRALSDGI